MTYDCNRVCENCGDSSPRVKICGECEAAMRAFADGEKSRQSEVDELKLRYAELEKCHNEYSKLVNDMGSHIVRGVIADKAAQEQLTKLQSDSAELTELKAALEWASTNVFDINLWMHPEGFYAAEADESCCRESRKRHEAADVFQAVLGLCRKLGWPGAEKPSE